MPHLCRLLVLPGFLPWLQFAVILLPQGLHIDIEPQRRVARSPEALLVYMALQRSVRLPKFVHLVARKILMSTTWDAPTKRCLSSAVKQTRIAKHDITNRDAEKSLSERGFTVEMQLRKVILENKVGTVSYDVKACSCMLGDFCSFQMLNFVLAKCFMFLHTTYTISCKQSIYLFL